MSDTALKEGPRPTADAMWKGFRCRCPKCGEGKLFRAFLRPVDVCERCDERMDGHRSDDLPPYVTMMIIGHVVVPIILAVEMSKNPWPLWIYFSVFLPLTLLGTLLLMQPVKGAIIGLQWALRLHGFDARGDFHAQALPASARPRKS
jgi:uncharacterized protein (DUF983 family)